MSLNPCCYGRWSQRLLLKCLLVLLNRWVLILVVMEDGLRDTKLQFVVVLLTLGLNPCCYGRWSQSGLLGIFYRNCLKVS